MGNLRSCRMFPFLAHSQGAILRRHREQTQSGLLVCLNDEAPRIAQERIVAQSSFEKGLRGQGGQWIASEPADFGASNPASPLDGSLYIPRVERKFRHSSSG